MAGGSSRPEMDLGTDVGSDGCVPDLTSGMSNETSGNGALLPGIHLSQEYLGLVDEDTGSSLLSSSDGLPTVIMNPPRRSPPIEIHKFPTKPEPE